MTTQVQDWVGPTGSAWSGVLDGNTPLTALMSPDILGIKAALTGVVSQSGVGLWNFNPETQSFQWTTSLAGIWSWRFEVAAIEQDASGKVTSAAGAGTDQFGNVHPMTLTRTL